MQYMTRDVKKSSYYELAAIGACVALYPHQDAVGRSEEIDHIHLHSLLMIDFPVFE
jgi:hypothetical protein